MDNIIKRYKPKVIFFVYKPILENCVSPLENINYGFNDNLNKYFNGSRVFLFPMPGIGKVTKDIIKSSMTELKEYLL